MNVAEGGGNAPPVTVTRSGVKVHHFSPAVEALENEGRLAGSLLRVCSGWWWRHSQRLGLVFFHGFRECLRLLCDGCVTVMTSGCASARVPGVAYVLWSAF